MMGGDFDNLPTTVDEAIEIHNEGIIDALNELFQEDGFETPEAEGGEK